jgi:hypothetical protein
MRVDGFELDEADNSLRILIADFSGAAELETITKIVCPNKNIGKVYFSKLISNLENITESTEKDYTKYVINIIIILLYLVHNIQK